MEELAEARRRIAVLEKTVEWGVCGCGCVCVCVVSVLEQTVEVCARVSVRVRVCPCLLGKTLQLSA
eukprot:2553929-Rhodomonas_salina.1